MTESKYKAYKKIRKENLRDSVSGIEVLLTDLGEITTRDIAKNELKSNKKHKIIGNIWN